MKLDFRRHFTRLALTALAAVLGSGVILGLVQANVQEWAKASGNDQYLVKYTGPAMDRLAAFTSSGPFVFITAMIVGGALFLWADSFVKRWSEWRISQSGKIFSIKNIDRRLASMTTLFILIIAVVMCAAWVAYENRPRTQSQTDIAPRGTNLETRLSLKFGSAGSLPIEDGIANVARWYALANVVVMVAADNTRKEIRTWNVFITFEKPVQVRQVVISSKDALPSYEVKDFGDKSAVIAFVGDLSNVSLEISVKSNAGETQTPRGGPVTTAAPTPAQNSMLSGRPVSGRGVVERLERLETEHAATVLELTAAKQQLEDKNKELAAVPAPTKPPTQSILIATRYYSAKNKEEVADRLDLISDVFNKTGEPLFLLAEAAINQSPWDRPGENIDPYIARMTEINSLVSKMNGDLYGQIVEKERNYRQEINKVLFPMIEFIEFQQSSNEFRNALVAWSKTRDTADNETKSILLNLVMAARRNFGVARDSFLKWTDQRMDIIGQARRELKS